MCVQWRWPCVPLLFNLALPVHHYGHGRVRGLLELDGNEEAAVLADIEPVIGASSDVRVKERLRYAGLEFGAASYFHCHHFSVRGDEVQFLSIPAPNGPAAAIGGNLPFASRSGERL